MLVNFALKRISMKGRIYVLTAALLLCTGAAFGKETARDSRGSWAASTSLPHWALLGSANVSLYYMYGNNLAVKAGVRYNPWHFSLRGGNALWLRHFTPHIGLQYWGGSCFDGWYTAASLLYSEYNVAGFARIGCIEGNFAGLEVGGGYSLPVSERFSLSLGAAAAAGFHKSLRYAAPVCGRILSRSGGCTAFISEITLSICYKL